MRLHEGILGTIRGWNAELKIDFCRFLTITWWIDFLDSSNPTRLIHLKEGWWTNRHMHHKLVSKWNGTDYQSYQQPQMMTWIVLLLKWISSPLVFCKTDYISENLNALKIVRNLSTFRTISSYSFVIVPVVFVSWLVSLLRCCFYASMLSSPGFTFRSSNRTSIFSSNVNIQKWSLCQIPTVMLVSILTGCHQKIFFSPDRP